ncbi:carboxypeptidase regulatory-like domain-containing protein [Maioricimonas sp. JC845]|uniref:carboxypeptidase regulatory-like domain-containing protein n=1 Tax=Maioricimonas sp. JC845 TaxID=3232138 RepID=UPI00345A9FB2
MYRVCLAALTTCLLAAGCGEPPIPKGTVRGTVEVGGKTYSNPNDVVLLSTATGQGATAPIQPDGTFAITKGIPTGTYVAFFAPRADPNATSAVPVTIDTTIPDKYWNEATSDLEVNVEAGENQVGLVIP